MSDALVHEFLTWISQRPRTYAETMEGWRSTCPRHPTWEDALLEGWIEVLEGETMHQARVILTARGRAKMEERD
jgi:hypothetical protein